MGIDKSMGLPKFNKIFNRFAFRTITKSYLYNKYDRKFYDILDGNLVRKYTKSKNYNVVDKLANQLIKG